MGERAGGSTSLRLPPPGGRGRGTPALGNSKERPRNPRFLTSTPLASSSLSPRPSSPQPSPRPFLHFHSLPARVPSSPSPSPSLPPSAALALSRHHLSAYPLALDFVPRGLGVSAGPLEPSRAPDGFAVPTLGRAPAAPNFFQLNFPPRRGQASPQRARPPARRARPRRGGLRGGEPAPRPGGGGALPRAALHAEPSAGGHPR